jgi:nitrate/nitrite-specific signal transduction histidine kinase
METATRYNEDYEMKMYFIIMELSNNIIKHSNAVNAFISIEEKTNHYSFMFKITVKFWL